MVSLKKIFYFIIRSHVLLNRNVFWGKMKKLFWSGKNFSHKKVQKNIVDEGKKIEKLKKSIFSISDYSF